MGKENIYRIWKLKQQIKFIGKQTYSENRMKHQNNRHPHCEQNKLL